jgi:hypothetical protein
MKHAYSPIALAIASAFILALTACSPVTTITQSGPVGAVPATIYVDSGLAAPAQVLAFLGNSTGNPSPSSTITLSALDIPISIATDPAGNLYLGTYTGIREYAAGSSGTATPVRTIPINSTTGIAYPNGVAADAAGNLYVADFPSSSILIFSPTANGSVAPSRTLSGALTGLTFPYQIAVDGADNLYVLNLAAPASILIFGPKANGNVAPDRSLSVLAIGMTVDSAGDIYTAGPAGIEVFASGASGNATPVRTISSKATGYAAYTSGIALDSSGNIYIASQGTLLNNVIPPWPTIMVFSATSSGDTLPTNSFTPTSWTPGLMTLATLAVH